MAERFRQSIKFNGGYWPSQQVVGEPNGTLIAGRNMVMRGTPGQIYAEVWKGVLASDPGGAGVNQYPPIQAFASATCTVGSDLIDFGAFLPSSILRAGMLIEIEDKLYLITGFKEDASPFKMQISPPFEGASSGTKPILVPRILSGINTGVALLYGGGNAVSLPRGHLIVAGIYPTSSPGGVVMKLNLSLDGLNGQNHTSAATTGLYRPMLFPWTGTAFGSPILLGLSKPTIVSAVAISGGAKGMPAGNYGVRIARGRTETTGYGNPSETVEVKIAANQMIRITLPATADSQTTWRIYGSLFSVAEGKTGPWYEVREIAVGPSTVDIEYRDFEIAGGQLATFDNEVPPEARAVSSFGGLLVAISCRGTLTNLSPGPVVQTSKAYNIEGFPASAALATGPVQNIVGFLEAEGRLYVYTTDYIHILTLTGNPDQPLTIRPLAQASIIRAGALVYVQGVLYGYGRKGPFRVGVAEGLQQEDRAFASAVRDVTQNWKAARVCVVYDSYTSSIIYIHANDHKESNAWVSVALVYHLNLDRWSTPLIIKPVFGGADADCNVTSAVAVNGRAILMCSDRLGVWEGEPNPILNQDWYLGSMFIDQGGEGLQKNIRKLSLTYAAASGYAAIYGNDSSDTVPMGLLDTIGTAGSRSGQINLTANPLIASSQVYKINVRNMCLFAVKVGGNYTAGPPHRVDEIMLEGLIHGPER